MPAKFKFPPNIFELTQACDERMRPLLEDERRRRIRAEMQADRPQDVDELAAERRREVVAKWRAKMALQEAAKAGADTPLDTLDARKLQGEHREMVKKAIDAKLARLAEESKATPLRLSEAAMATEAGRPPVKTGESAA